MQTEAGPTIAGVTGLEGREERGCALRIGGAADDAARGDRGDASEEREDEGGSADGGGHGCGGSVDGVVLRSGKG
jgi:hypothetical protein